MKKKIALILCTLLVMAGGGAVWAASSSTYKQIGAYFEKIQLSINNHYTPLAKEAIIYDGTVYVPLRALGTRLGATVTWNPQMQAVEFTFSPNRWSALNLAGRQGLYQYIMMENDNIMRSMAEALRTNNLDQLGEAAARYDLLVKFASDLDERDQDNDISDIVQYLTKIRMAAGLLHTGWATRNMEDYNLAMDIFQTNERLLLEKLQGIIDEMNQ